MKFEQPPVQPPVQGNKNGSKEKEETLRSKFEALKFEPLNLSEIVPTEMKIEGIDKLQAGLNEAHENLMRVTEKLCSSLESMQQSIENDPQDKEKISVIRKVLNRVDESFGKFADKVMDPFEKKLQQFIRWVDSGVYLPKKLRDESYEDIMKKL